MSKWWCGTLLVVAAIGLTACGSSSNSNDGTSASGGEKAVRVAIVLPGLDNPFFRDVKEGAEAAAKRAGNVDLSVVAPPSQAQVQPLLDLIQDQTTKGVDAVAVVPFEPSVYEPALRRLDAAGIPVVGLGTDRVGKLKLAGGLTFDQAGATDAAMREMVRQMGGRGDAGVLTAPGNSNVEIRVAAARRTLDEAGVPVVADAPMDCQLRGLNATEDVLQKEPQLKALFVPCGTAAVYAARAFARAGRKGDDYVLWGFDGTPEELAAIKDGRMDGTVRFDGAAIGATLEDLTARAGRDEDLGAVRGGAYDIVTADNVDQFIGSAK
jgi:ribose transport system substrate-binding protein